MKRIRTSVLIALASLSCHLVAVGAMQTTPPRALYIIFDGSNSMWGELPDKSRKIEAAKSVFNALDPSVFAGRDVALRMYGHRRAADCDDIELAVPFTSASGGVVQMAERVDGVTPRGKTPITRSLKAALEDFDGRSGDILLISDGIETCDADPCDLVRSWRDDNIAIRVHVVGLGLSDMAESAMQCIAEASGTEYMDADSASDLVLAIEQTASSEPPPPGSPEPAPNAPGGEFRVAGQDSDGNFVPVAGTLAHDARGAVDVRSNRRYVFEAGDYTLTVGVPTLNGETYEPVTEAVHVKQVGETRVTVTVPRPPRVTTRFVAGGEEVRGPLARSYRDGKEIFALRPNEEHYILPGSYEFRAKLDQDNDLTITETVSAGEDKVLLFEAVQTVRTVFAVRADGSDAVLRQHQELYRDGELIYKVHFNNGADIRPGTYTLRSDHPLTPYTIDDVVVPAQDRQTIELSVPFGRAAVTYRFAGEPPTKDLRCWLQRVDATGKQIARSRALQCDGREIHLITGKYRVRTWNRLGEFPEVVFEITTGVHTDVEVPAR